MNVCLDARPATTHFPGIGRYVINLSGAITPGLDEGDRLFVLRDPTRSSVMGLTASEGHRTRVVNVPLTPFSIRQQWVVPRVLNSLGADVYHCSYYLMPYWTGVPTVLTVYDLIPLLFPRHSSAKARLLFRWLTALALRTAASVVAISHSTRRDLLGVLRVPPQKVTVVPLAAGPGFRPQLAAEVARVRLRYALPVDYVLYLGSNKPHKNLVRLVAAWAQLQPQPFPLVVAGAWDPRHQRPRECAQTLGLDDEIRWLGRVPDSDLPALYTGAIAFVFPSLYEGFGLPVLEAMACGTPVACSNSSSLPEVSGDAAVAFDPTSVRAIADGLAGVLASADLRAELRERGLRQATRFSWERAARETIEAYRRVSIQ